MPRILHLILLASITPAICWAAEASSTTPALAPALAWIAAIMILGSILILTVARHLHR